MEIKINDVVLVGLKPVVVTRVLNDGKSINGLDVEGNCYAYPVRACERTGRSIDIQSVLDEIGKE